SYDAPCRSSNRRPSDLQILRLLCRMRMRVARVHLELAQHRIAERPLRQHALHCFLQHALGMRGVQLAEARLLQAAGISAVTVIGLALGLASRDAKLRRVYDH